MILFFLFRLVFVKLITFTEAGPLGATLFYFGLNDKWPTIAFMSDRKYKLRLTTTHDN